MKVKLITLISLSNKHVTHIINTIMMIMFCLLLSSLYNLLRQKLLEMLK